MNLKNFIIQIILPIIIGIIWTIIELIPEPDWKVLEINYGKELYPYIEYMWNERIFCGLIITIIIILIMIVGTLTDKPSKQWLRVYLKHLMAEAFNNDYSTTRITIFKKVSGWRMMRVYLKYIFFTCLIQHLKEKTFILHLKRIPNPFSKYLMIYVRCSNPHPDGSSTYFPIAKSNHDVCGLSSYCIYSKSKQTINTEYISAFYNPLKNDYNKFEQAKINRYIKDNKMTEDVIKCIHRLSNHIIAEPIFDENEDIWGALVVDIDSPNENVFNKDCEAKLSTAIRVISFTLSHLNK